MFMDREDTFHADGRKDDGSTHMSWSVVYGWVMILGSVHGLLRKGTI